MLVFFASVRKYRAALPAAMTRRHARAMAPNSIGIKPWPSKEAGVSSLDYDRGLAI